MRRLEVEEFAIEVPQDWRSFREGNRLVLQRVDTEVILSSHRLTAAHGQSAPTALVDRAFSAATETAMNAATQPELEEVVVERSRDVWALTTRTRDGLIFFGQIVRRGSCSVLLLTFESPCNDLQLNEFRDLWLECTRSSVIRLRRSDRDGLG